MDLDEASVVQDEELARQEVAPEVDRGLGMAAGHLVVDAID
jgi:hypothetical protein